MQTSQPLFIIARAGTSSLARGGATRASQTSVRSCNLCRFVRHLARHQCQICRFGREVFRSSRLFARSTHRSSDPVINVVIQLYFIGPTLADVVHVPDLPVSTQIYSNLRAPDQIRSSLWVV
ncbi:uncharacterized protein LOC120070550 [Benincasa hispida]|uniref:uncharacterized protein LOC120070550 n=1 Tax=Benincasa hispida TaxID=102211 RepID=UPI0018FF4681|nr:uncharacterized protein LOC120070550 [Benincasa hispida]